jgi:hypothetical protein
LYFTAVQDWVGGAPYTHSTYGPTIYKNLASGGTISKTFSITPAHYKIRMLVSIWLIDVLNDNPITSATVNSPTAAHDIKIRGRYNTTQYYNFGTVINIPLAAQTTTNSGGRYIYHPTFRATNKDV